LPKTEVVFFRENDGRVPLVDWLATLPPVARAKCRVRLDLRNGIYELRAKHAGVNYRMLYFFRGRTAAVVSHGIMKQQAEVPPKDIERAVQRKAMFEAHPQRHTFIPPED